MVSELFRMPSFPWKASPGRMSAATSCPPILCERPNVFSKAQAPRRQDTATPRVRIAVQYRPTWSSPFPIPWLATEREASSSRGFSTPPAASTTTRG